MLAQTLYELAAATALSNVALAEVLRTEVVQLLESKGAEPGTFAARCRELLYTELDRDFSRQFRLNDLESAFHLIVPDDLGTNGQLPLLDDLVERAFDVSSGQIHYRANRIADYAKLCSRLDPAMIAGWHLATRIEKAQGLSDSGLISIVAQARGLFAPPHDDEPYGENHVHIYGISGVDLGMATLLFDSPSGSKDKSGDDRLPALQRWLGCLRGYSALPNSAKVSEMLIGEFIGGGATAAPVAGLCPTLRGPQPASLSPRDPPWLSWQMNEAWSRKNTDEAWLWFFTWIWTYYKLAPSRVLRLALLHAVVVLMDIRYRSIMDGQGLTRFTHRFPDATRLYPNRKGRQRSAVQRIFAGTSDVAEIKLAYEKDPHDAIKKIGYAIAAHLNRAAWRDDKPDASLLARSMDRWHICVHFNRFPVYLANESLVWDEIEKLAKALVVTPSWISANSQDVATGVLSKPLSHWIRGIDVAGDENAVKIEVFAPALRLLRFQYAKGFRSESAPGVHHVAPELNRSSPRGGLHLSVHAGEDYADLLSGMRHVDETVVFCGMHKGDRLGHALALGIEPEQWARRQGMVLIDIDEHVDNLVWAWGMAADLAAAMPVKKRPDIHAIRVKFEQRALHFASMLPWLTRPLPAATPVPTISVLWEAWKLRRNSFYHLDELRRSGRRPCEITTLIPDLSILTSSENHPAAALHINRARWLSENQSVTTDDERPPAIRPTKLMPKVHITLGGKDLPTGGHRHAAYDLIEDTCPDSQLEFMHALQDLLVTRYAKTGISIETNPTSNVYIARLKNYQEHPIFRWHPLDTSTLAKGAIHNRFGLRKAPIPITVNTDDPGVMPTNLRMEFALLKDAALAHLDDSNAINTWAETLRKEGVDEFSRKHLP
ncbi:hypothetical protein LFL96_14550 [Paraburkholderia sp. D15]|uniref:hypothetical protein n=1 Tax=Paraburkholderia sp. D15 TaxID=2880218 RepID=UPI00247B05DF|nr:hypothetical protein [Paraburkholderia sp. D15]WGS48982.1 hypothetical protein LFL96_14550 [Paraburkholderia sp. D15]